MKELEKLFEEYKIRFNQTERILDNCRACSEMDNESYFYIEYNEKYLINRNGIVWSKENGWRYADVRIAPEKWVIEKDPYNPLWQKFEDEYRWGLSAGRFYSRSRVNHELTSFENYQLLSLKQWYELVYLPELYQPNIGDIGFFFSNVDPLKIHHVSTLIDIPENGYKAANGGKWDFFFKITDPTKPFNKVFEDFKSYVTKKQ